MPLLYVFHRTVTDDYFLTLHAAVRASVIARALVATKNEFPQGSQTSPFVTFGSLLRLVIVWFARRPE